MLSSSGSQAQAYLTSVTVAESIQSLLPLFVRRVRFLTAQIAQALLIIYLFVCELTLEKDDFCAFKHELPGLDKW